MIKNIKLKNFQSHKESFLEFHPNINIISGSSDSGKSSLIRGINLLLNNHPSGIDFITHNEKQCQIKAEIDNHIIERNKSEKINNYIIDGKELTAFGQDVPDEIKQATNFNELNLQMQFDNPFLISESSGEVTRILNKVINLEIIDESLQRSEKIKRQYKREVDNYTDLIQQYQNDINKYDWIKDYEKRLNDTIIKNQLSIAKVEKFRKLETIINKLNQYLIDIKKYNDILKYEKQFNLLEDRFNNLQLNQIKFQKLTGNIIRLKQYGKEKEVLYKILQYDNKVKLLNDRAKNLELNRQKKNKLNNIVIDLSEKNNNIKGLDLLIYNLQEKYNQIKPNTCPVCNQEWK